MHNSSPLLVYNVFFNASGWTGCIGFQRERGIGRFFMNMNYIFCCIKYFLLEQFGTTSSKMKSFYFLSA